MPEQRSNVHQLIEKYHLTAELTNVTFDMLITHWEEQTKKLDEQFKKRELEKVSEPMVSGIVQFFCALYLANDQPISNISFNHWQEQTTNFVAKPLNVEERLTYVIENPQHYHAYFQLKQLYNELIKKHAIQKSKANKENSPTGEP